MQQTQTETNPAAAGDPVQMSLEEVRDKIREAVGAWAADTGGPGWVSNDATFADLAVVSVHTDAHATSYQVPYTVTDAGAVTIGDPAPATLTVSRPSGGDPLVAVLNEAAAAVKHLGSDVETKAGRVLSSANAKDLTAAVANLITVMRRAGIDIPDPGKPAESQPERLPEEPTTHPDSTAPSALPVEMKTLSAAEIAEGAEIMAYALTLQP
ncbi:hypothetical protein SAMN05421505_12032 [Sinosporangium album]|uniref:Uncharacterized protein n=1 Tax=Sinosporangium album TaxID=504805 RepID=A0A1G8EBZ9_9ACTN|nr:hypothetical protein [Sinosporangium album]SDH67413.1 hypothetical protein SAMN05421505_12032 [Sinosporangium album]